MYQTQHLHQAINNLLWAEVNQSAHPNAPVPRRLASEFLLSCSGNAGEYNDILTHAANVVEIEYLNGRLQNDAQLQQIVKQVYTTAIPFIAYHRLMNNVHFDANMRVKIENGYRQWNDLFAGATNELNNIRYTRQNMQQQQYGRPYTPPPVNPYGGMNASQYDPAYAASQLGGNQPLSPNLMPRTPSPNGRPISALDKGDSLLVTGQSQPQQQGQPAAKYAPRQTSYWEDHEPNRTPTVEQAVVEEAIDVEPDKPIKWFGSEGVFWNYPEEQHRLGRDLPSDLYPVNGSELEMVNGELCKRHNGNYYVVWASNPLTPSCPAFDDLKKASTIRLTSEYLPYFILKKEEEKIVMELSDHIIPGEQVPSHLASRPGTVVSQGHRFDVNQEVKKSLELSPEEHEEQMNQLIAEGLEDAEIAEYMSVVDLEQHVATNEVDLATTVVSNALSKYNDPEVVESVTWVENPVVAIGGAERAMSVLRGIYECNTIEEFKDKVLFPLRDMGEVAVFERLCGILDKNYNLMLTSLPICDIEVDDVINCHQEVVDGYVKPRNLTEYYQREVPRMLHNMLNVDAYIDEYELDNPNVVPLAEKVTTAYIGLTFNELHLTKSCGVREWRTLIEDSDSLLYAVCNKLCKMSRDDLATYRHQVVTKDGLTVDVVLVRGRFPSIQVRFNHK